MASTTTNLGLIKPGENESPDIKQAVNDNMDTLDTEVAARAKYFNGQPVGTDGGFTVDKIRMADNLDSTYAQRSDESFAVRTTGGEASIEDGDAWLLKLKGTRTHVGYAPYAVDMQVIAMEREEPITATIDEETFVAYVSPSETTVTLTYAAAWSADPALYGITVEGTPVAGDVIKVLYTPEQPGTIYQSNPQTLVSTGWNLYDHENEYAHIIRYSDTYNFKIDGTYTQLEFSETIDGDRVTLTPVGGGFGLPAGVNEGYVFVTGGNDTDTEIWMTRQDWGDEPNGGVFEAYSEAVVDFHTVMGSYFPHGLLQVGTVQDEIDLNIGVATSNVERLVKNASNLADAKASGRQYEYDENWIYLEKATPDTYSISVEGDYTASDHGMEFFTYSGDARQATYAETIYGANLKNKLERDVLTISQQTLETAQKAQVLANIGAASVSSVSHITDFTGSIPTDFNALPVGKPCFARWGTATPHSPRQQEGLTNAVAGCVISYRTNTNGFQFAWEQTGNPDMYMRSYYDGEWHPWVRASARVNEQIPADSNLNNYRIPGTYYSASGSATTSISNTPSGLSGAFLLEVLQRGSYVFQRITSLTAASVYMRTSKSDGWNEWKYIAAT